MTLRQQIEALILQCDCRWPALLTAEGTATEYTVSELRRIQGRAQTLERKMRLRATLDVQEEVDQLAKDFSTLH